MMYSDIVPPKKNSIRNITRDSSIYEESTEQQIIYTERIPREKKVPRFVLFLLIAVLLIGGIIYAKFSERTVITFAPKTTTLDIRERIPVVLADSKTQTDADTLAYSLIYISSKGERNPFLPLVTATSTPTTSAAPSTSLNTTELIATSTGAKMAVYIVNKTGEALSLRVTTRFDVNGVIYSTQSAMSVPVTKDPILLNNSGTKYFLPGFKGTAQAEQIYAVAVDSPSMTEEQTADSDTTATTSEVSKSTVPEDILSLLPETSVALRKSTIYDQSLGQTAVVIFDKKDLIAILQKKSPTFLEYITAFTPLEDLVSYNIVVADYELESAGDTGRPTAFKKLVIEITPTIDTQKTKTVFTNFSMDAMDKIEEQIARFADLDVSNTPFWKQNVAEEGRVDVKIEE